MTPIPTLLSELDALAEKAHPQSPWPTFTSHEIAYYHALCDALPLLRAEILRLREATKDMVHAQGVIASSELHRANRFVEFVLRHTRPARAKAHGFEAVHSIIANHPFAKTHRAALKGSEDEA